MVLRQPCVLLFQPLHFVPRRRRRLLRLLQRRGQPLQRLELLRERLEFKTIRNNSKQFEAHLQRVAHRRGYVLAAAHARLQRLELLRERWNSKQFETIELKQFETHL